MAGEKGSEKLYTQAEFDAAVAAAAKDSARIAIKTVDIKRAELKEDQKEIEDDLKVKKTGKKLSP